MSGNAEEDSAPGKEPPGFRQEPGGSFLFTAPVTFFWFTLNRAGALARL